MEQKKLMVQETLDELYSENRLPFKLTAYGVRKDVLGAYVVPFYDSRLRSMTFSWQDDRPFKEVVRVAVMDRVRGMSGPLRPLRSLGSK